MKVIIAGSRSFSNYAQLEKFCDQVLVGYSDISIVSGGARGADKLGEQYAAKRGYPLVVFPADWDTFGKSAGYRRNQQMAEYADALIAFWDGESRGTQHMIDLARKNDLIVFIH